MQTLIMKGVQQRELTLASILPAAAWSWLNFEGPQIIIDINVNTQTGSFKDMSFTEQLF